jgi:hypothetical protein
MFSEEKPVKTLIPIRPTSSSSAGATAEEEYIYHLLNVQDEPPRLYEHICWYIRVWGPNAVLPLVHSARSQKVRRTAACALQNSMEQDPQKILGRPAS